MQDIDFLVVGDALIDTFLFLKSNDQHFHASEAENEMCFTVGSKIPVDDAQFCLGGNACNVAVGLKRLGLQAALVAETGDDGFSHMVKKGLENEGISLDFFKRTPNTPATFSVNLVFANDRTILSRHVKRKHAIAFESAKATWVYLTSLGEEWQPMYEKVLQYVSENNITLSFNPGSRQLKAGKESFIHILERADVLFVNKEEAQQIAYGEEHMAYSNETMDNLLKDVQRLGPRIVSITDGEKGSSAIDKQGSIYRQAIIPGEFVQKTGVGDAYATGFLGSLFYHPDDVQQAMLWGALNASNVIAHMGAQPGLLTKEGMEERINK